MSARPEGAIASAAISKANEQDAPLLALALRCEAATGTDRELDDAIFAAAHPEWLPAKKIDHVFVDDVRFADTNYISKHTAIVKRFTSSLDAAMMLVPEGYEFMVGTEGKQGHACVNQGSDFGDDIFAATPALALCAAALRARATLSGNASDEVGK